MEEEKVTFNLLVSTAADFEEDCFNEMWYHLFSLGDENPLYVRLFIPGLIGVQTKLEPRKVIKYFQDEFDRKGANYFKFIFKIIPIQLVVISEEDTLIKESINIKKQNEKNINADDTFRIKVVRRFTEIKTDFLIQPIAKAFTNKVDLKNPTWELRIEICRKISGISFIRPDEIFEPRKEQKKE